MNKELTAMQLLIEEIDHKLDTEISDTLRYSLEKCQKIAKRLLQKEQEQIEKAFGDGVSEGESRERMEEIYLSIGDYYQSKYGGEDENT